MINKNNMLGKEFKFFLKITNGKYVLWLYLMTVWKKNYAEWEFKNKIK